MLTLVPNLADGYLSGQRRSPESILLVQLPHCFPPGMCFAATKFRLNRLRRWPSSCMNPLVGFNNHACMLHAISLLAQPTTQSQSLIVDFQHVCPLHNSLYQLWTHGSFIWRPSPYTVRSGMNSVPLFCKFYHALVATASSFCFNCLTCDSSLLLGLQSAPKPICRRRSQTPRLLCSACSLRFVTLWATLDSVRSIHT